MYVGTFWHCSNYSSALLQQRRPANYKLEHQLQSQLYAAVCSTCWKVSEFSISACKPHPQHVLRLKPHPQHVLRLKPHPQATLNMCSGSPPQCNCIRLIEIWLDSVRNDRTNGEVILNPRYFIGFQEGVRKKSRGRDTPPRAICDCHSLNQARPFSLQLLYLGQHIS